MIEDYKIASLENRESLKISEQKNAWVTVILF